jgi:hypothetical protein
MTKHIKTGTMLVIEAFVIVALFFVACAGQQGGLVREGLASR